jgi:hypothetical protein
MIDRIFCILQDKFKNISNGMKKIAFVFVLFLLTAGFGLPVRAAERIQDFNTKVTINRDASLNVSETITYDFGGESKHGIYRFIPMLDGNKKNFGISQIKVSDQNGQPSKFEAYKEGDNQVIKIGDADVLISGKHVYQIDYKIKNGMIAHENHDELYLNVTGVQWPVAIISSEAEVILPDSFDQKDLQKYCYAGAYSSKQTCYSSDFKFTADGKVDGVHFFSGPLESEQGLTVVVGLPKGFITYPPKTFLIRVFEATNTPWVFLLSVIFLAVLLSFWIKIKSSARGSGTIIPQYDAPDGLTPAEIGTIVDTRLDNKDISADIVNLAVKGYLKIISQKKEGIIVSKKEFILEKLKNSDDLANDWEKDLMDRIFEYRQNNDVNKAINLFGPLKTLFRGLQAKTSGPAPFGSDVKLSDLQGGFMFDLRNIRKALYKSLVDKGYFQSYPQKIKIWLIVLSVFCFILAKIFFGVSLLLSLSIFLDAFIAAVFSAIWPVRTQKGELTKEYIKGLKLYLNVAEKDRLDFHNAPDKTPQCFEKLLPYAIALGVEKNWAKQFQGIYTAQPNWYQGNLGAFNAVIFADSLKSFTTAAGRNFSPQGGQGSGLGGGGFSGGGIGGGGGGSW